MNSHRTLHKVKTIRKALYKEEVHAKPKTEMRGVLALASTHSYTNANTSSDKQTERKVYLNQLTMDNKDSTLNNNNNSSSSVSLNGGGAGVHRKKGSVVNEKRKASANKTQLKYPLKVNLSFHVHKPQTLVKSTTHVIIHNNNVNSLRQSSTRNRSMSSHNQPLGSRRQLSAKSLTKVHNTLTPRSANSHNAIHVRLKASDDHIGNKELYMKIKSQRNKIKEEALHKKYKNDEMKLQIYEMKTKLNQIINERLKTEITKLEQLEKQYINTLQRAQNKSSALLRKADNVSKTNVSSSPQVKPSHTHSQRQSLNYKRK